MEHRYRDILEAVFERKLAQHQHDTRMYYIDEEWCALEKIANLLKEDRVIEARELLVKRMDELLTELKVLSGNQDADT